MSMDDSAVDYSATDWREKYNEVADMLEQTRSELDDFHVASKELEAELEAELQRTERAQKDLMVKVAHAEGERDDWKTKFMSLQTTHNTTTTSLQRELDQLRQDHQRLKVQFRELEMGNDDLERNERAVSSSLADVESKYSRVLEEKILLEHELLDKASLEEECQRLKDELRDATEEARILHDQIKSSSASISEPSSSPLASQEDLLKTPPPGDLLLSELGPSTDSLPSIQQRQQLQITPKAIRTTPGRTLASPSRMPLPKSNGIPRATTAPSLRTPITRPSPAARNPSIASSTTTTSSTGTTSKHKGVQMVSELRARVKNLEQRMTTQVPRFRMKSINGRANANPATSTYSGTNGSINSNKSVSTKAGWDGFGNIRRSVDSKKSTDSDEKKGSDSTGWVLIMEDSPSPRKAKMSEEAKLRERRRASSPLGTPGFKPTASVAHPPRTTISPKPIALAQSTMIRRPGSRLSGGSSLSSATTSSIPTPTSRPSTPTMLPIPNGSAHLKRSMGGPLSTQAKRSSFGSSTIVDTPAAKRERPLTMPPPLPTNRHSLDYGHQGTAFYPLHSNCPIGKQVTQVWERCAVQKQNRDGQVVVAAERHGEARSTKLRDLLPCRCARGSSSSAAATVDGIAGEYDETETF
ncbi:hypothetical protein DL96DRAFT_1573195 [Flagelloscypha sp. PMI_526]|nr:hypothetical protein DL96DRAFT_1573195 [Flagelloscypha sp. PMI_526]